jgi:RNA polymerase sigma-70 factor (ECF subfamily)
MTEEADAQELRFLKIVHDHGNTVLKYIQNRHFSSDAVDAEDLLADVLATAWRCLDDVPIGAEAPWLIGVARHRLMNAHSRSQRRYRIASRMHPRASSPSAEDVALADLSIRRALSRLPEREREALTLTAWEGLSPRELAVALGISMNAASVRLSKAKSHLLKLLGEQTESSSPIANHKE